MDTVIAKEYKISKKLGSGAFGEVFMAIHAKNRREVAVKLEHANNKSPQLYYEGRILSNLGGGEDSTTDYGLPQIYHLGTEGEYNVMVMTLFGSSLEDIFISHGRKFDLKTTLMVGIQMIERI